jgi:GAF domain-containing protein
MQCPRCQHANPSHAKFCMECGTPLSPHKAGSPQASYEDQERALSEALEQQTATSEILRVISHSPNDVQPVFDSIAASALRLCDAKLCTTFTFDGELIHLVASHHVTEEGAAAYRDTYPSRPGRASGTHRAILTRTIVHIPDIREDPEYELRALARANDYGCVLAVPMLRDGHPVGVITVGREAARPFPSEQIALLRTFAQQAVIAIENVRLFKELEARNRDLTEALEQQTATSELLKVIGRSTFDLQPVFETLAENAVRLCEAEHAFIFGFDGQVLRSVATHNIPPALKAFVEANPVRPGRESGAARAAMERRTVHIEDIQTEPGYTYGVVQVGPMRTLLAVPMLRAGELLGVIVITRPEVRLFTDGQIALMETFADQAAIAIENARLFTELQEKNQALTVAHAQVTEALEQQTATAEILRVISRSPTDVQPVFDTIIQSAVRLCGARIGALYRFDGELLHLAAHHNFGPNVLATLLRLYPMRPNRETASGRAILGRAVAELPDVLADPEFRHEIAIAGDWRSMLAVPMLREGDPIGAIVINRSEPGAFPESQIALLQTFADQAVIAIENVRLFTELQASNRELTTALDTQTATSDILRVISRSQTDVQPVFDAIVASAVRLLGAYSGVLTRIKDDQIELAALTSTNDAGDTAARTLYPEPLQSERVTARAIRERVPLNSTDAHTDPRLPEAEHARARVRGYRSLVVVPMLRHDEAVGAIAVTRREAGGFSDDDIALLKTFADQAVIAIENARLLSELQARTAELTRSVEELRALGEVSQALSSTLDLDAVLNTIVSRASQLAGAAGCSIYEYDEAAEQFELRATHSPDTEFVEALRAARLRKGEGLMGRAAEMREPIQIADITEPGAYQSSVRDTLIRFGYRALLSVPLLREDQIIGSLSFNRKAPGEFSPEVVDVLKTFATQSALAIQNARLFREIADKSRQLEAASRHKSEFLANMSHELRTPLNAIIGFSEVLAQGMFGEINAKQTEYLQDILESGRHLLSLINDILDLSKIEAGRMELELSAFDLPQAIQNALTLVRERALRREIALQHAIDDRVAGIRADERKVKQVLLNLLSNAIKFTPEGGGIEVRAAPVDGMVEVSVTDTGVGIAPEDQETVFEEFRQVGTADRKAEGTGLGLALSRKFVELHGGRIWVKSQVGVGSTFTFTLPMCSDR